MPLIRPPLMIDPHTFGKYPAAVILVDKLNNEIRDAYLARRVVKFIHRTQNGLARLAEIEDNDWFNNFRKMWIKERMALVDSYPFHPEIDTYVKNVIKTDSKEWLRSTLSLRRQAMLPKYPTMNRQGVLEV